MEKSIRNNVYSIVIVSFCIGVLFGIRVHADVAASSTDNYSDASTLFNQAQVQLDRETAKESVIAHSTDIKSEIASMQRTISKSNLDATAKNLQAASSKLGDCSTNECKDLKPKIDSLVSQYHDLSAHISIGLPKD
jgi:hypothetical protein